MESMGVYCPYCKEPVETKHIKPFTFPDTFYQMCGKFDCRCDNQGIQRMIDEISQELIDYPESEFNYIVNDGIAVLGYVEDTGEDVYHHILVAKELWEDEIKIEVDQDH